MKKNELTLEKHWHVESTTKEFIVIMMMVIVITWLYPWKHLEQGICWRLNVPHRIPREDLRTQGRKNWEDKTPGRRRVDLPWRFSWKDFTYSKSFFALFHLIWSHSQNNTWPVEPDCSEPTQALSLAQCLEATLDTTASFGPSLLVVMTF